MDEKNEFLKWLEKRRKKTSKEYDAIKIVLKKDIPPKAAKGGKLCGIKEIINYVETHF